MVLGVACPYFTEGSLFSQLVQPKNLHIGYATQIYQELKRLSLFTQRKVKLPTLTKID